MHSARIAILFPAAWTATIIAEQTSYFKELYNIQDFPAADRK